MKRLFACLLSFVMLMSLCFAPSVLASAGPAAQSAGQDAPYRDSSLSFVHTQEGRVTFAVGDCAGKPVRSMEDAAGVLPAVSSLLGADDRTHFEPWRVLRDPFGNTYYVFQQTCADMIVLGGAVKIITDADGKMLGCTGSVVSDLPDEEHAEALTREQAEALVLAREENAQLMTGLSQRLVLPVDRILDMEADEIQTRFVWAVYTTNPSAGASGSSALPYLAHYVSMSGEYLYSLPTILPGDAAAQAGYDADYVFSFMEPAEYTGYVDWSDGTEREITVALMRDTRTGMYYLGNLEHRIVVADCWEFLYNGGRVVLEYSPDNLEWDQVGLISLWNYCRACDSYREIGWDGPDGAQTPIIVLKDFCDADHNPIDNAAYAGKIYGWQCFLSSGMNDFAQCLDVCAHEFTHCVTDTTMTYSPYHNDFGAINEAISDIQGNICEMLLGATDDTTWLMGEHSTEPVRSMSDPNLYGQPACSWDLHYQANVLTPTDINDLGGVHTNSSLLSRLAFLLCEEGMTLEKARAFWFAVDCAIVPSTDFRQLRELLPWMLRITGLEAHRDAMAKALDATRLGADTLPEEIDPSQAMLVLNLPDNDVFGDGNWVLSATGLDVDALEARFAALAGQIESGDVEDLPVLLRELLTEEALADVGAPEVKQGLMDLFAESLLDALLSGDAAQEEDDAPTDPDQAAKIREAQDWLAEQLKGIAYSGMAGAGEDGHTIRMMGRPGRIVPVLLYMRVAPNSDQLEKMKAVLYLNHRWVDVTGFLPGEAAADDPEETGHAPGLLESGILFDLLDILFSGKGLKGIVEGITLYAPGGTVTEISAAGLDQVTLAGNMAFDFGEETQEVNHAKSRPKLTVEGE